MLEFVTCGRVVFFFFFPFSVCLIPLPLTKTWHLIRCHNFGDSHISVIVIVLMSSFKICLFNGLLERIRTRDPL